MLDMAGVLLMYFNTPLHTRKPQSSVPFDDLRKSADWLFWGKKLERKERKMIRIGVVLIVCGFLGQFASGFFK